ncbi:hypothetical protein ABMA27_008754 [Loxostege sticticalis]|uniref:THAP-type domain-containing protein n=1 Tax=Loxostege sticticalis TaxID=481309 RepID=A0ABR3HCH9_LOXSC
MPSCVVKWCKNNTTSQKKCQGITFHRFPTGNEPWKDDWTRIIRNCRGQEDWSASKSSVVCSIHFDQNDLYTTSKGLRRLVTYATRIKLRHSRRHFDSQCHSNGGVVLSYIYGITDLKGSSKDVIKQRIAISEGVLPCTESTLFFFVRK